MFQTAFQVNAFQNDAFQIVITPVVTTTRGGDGWTKEEWKRAQAIDKKLRLAEEKRIAAVKADQEARKSLIRNQIDPKVSKSKQSKVQSKQQVSEDTPSEVTKFDALIANLERQKQDLFDAVLIRQAKARLEQELQVLEAKRQAELDDEEALLALLL
jgi:DNA polymerase II large subunit